MRRFFLFVVKLWRKPVQEEDGGGDENKLDFGLEQGEEDAK
jgi:hypothetical protein